MSKKLDTVWSLDPHTKAKHDLLVRYLGGWFAVLSKYNGRIVFLDGFAGPGVYSKREPGSPTLALRTLLEHQHKGLLARCKFLFIFNEQDAARFRSLEHEVEKIKGEKWPVNVDVTLANMSFVEVADDILQYLGEDKVLAPTFAFLDPFGYKGIPIHLIARLLAFDKCELFIYWDFNSVNRFATRRQRGCAL
jgi:three-Cys-motif partner protein